MEDKDDGNVVDIKLGPGFAHMLNSNVAAQKLLERCISTMRS